MPGRRFKTWLLVVALLGMLGFFGFIFFAGTMKNAVTSGDEDRPVSSGQAGTGAALVQDVSGDSEETAAFNSTGTIGSDESEPAFTSATTNTTSGDDARAATMRRMEDSWVSVCDVPQPPLAANFCAERLKEGAKYMMQRASEAVGNLEIDEDQISCSGVLLNSDSKIAMYFLTAAHCLPNEKNVDRARIHFTGCAGTNTFTKNKVYAISRRLGYVILRMETNADEMRAAYGFLHLRATHRVDDEQVFIPHYTYKRAVQSVTVTWPETYIKVQPYKGIQGCVVESPQSRVSYEAPRMDRVAAGAPVISISDGSVVALHLCGDCSVGTFNSGLVSHSIVVDLDSKAQTMATFSQKGHAEDEVR